jgi:hypothetical protein
MQLSNLGGIALNSTITGLSSGTTAKVIGTNPGTLPNVVGYVVTSGPGFTANEAVQISGITQGTVQIIPYGLPDPYTAALFLQGAANYARTSISAVPGSGNILGVIYLNSVVYAFRNNVGGTQANLYKSTAGGWVQVPYGWELSYTAGVGTPALPVGTVVTGVTSGATGTIAAVINQTGTVIQGVPTWAGSSGRFIFSSVTGTFQSGETLRIAGPTNIATNGTTAAVQIAPLPNGSYSIDVASFGGAFNTQKLAWGADGVNRAFSFDGTTYIPISTGATPDTPSIAKKHLNYLLLAIGNNLQISGLGLPYQWSPLVGGASIQMIETITNLNPLPGNQATGAIIVTTTSFTSILYGSTTNTFQLVPYNFQSGAYPNTCINLADTYVFESRGIGSVTTTLQYGNFDPSFVTMPIRPFIDLHRQYVTCAYTNRNKSQYRVFFSDGYGLWATFLNKQYSGSMPVIFPNPVLCCEEDIDPVTGAQRMFFGSSNGFVYEMEKGTSFDGVAIAAALQFVFDSKDSHRVIKRYRKASLEVTGSIYAAFSVGYALGYSAATVGQPPSAAYNIAFTSAIWDAFTWDNFTWDGVNLLPAEIEITGTAENIALSIASTSDLVQPFTINTATIHYTPRRGLR